jgi:hypothetical protein
MISRRLAGAFVCLLGLTLLGGTGSSPAQSRDITVEGMRAENRLALVVGNATYATSPLRNPVNDARAMAQTLRDLGFDVILRENANENAMKRAINEFGDRLGRGGVGLFFYAGPCRWADGTISSPSARRSVPRPTWTWSRSM